MKARMIILSFVFCFLACGSILAENINTINVQKKDENKVFVKGVVVTIKGDVLPFSTVKVTLTSSGKDVSFAQVTDDKGGFCISVDVAPKYVVEAKFMGMKTKTFEVTQKQIKDNTITIELEEDAKALDQVVVSKKRELIKVEVDKISYDIAGDPSSAANTVLDMLRKVPLVTVSGDGEIQVNGSKDFQIFLNGKPTKVFGEKPQEVLRTMPAVAIKNVEVITDPGVKYAVDGAPAILNLITESKTATNGYNGSLSSSFSLKQYEWYNSNNAYFNMSKNDWGFNINLRNFNNLETNKPVFSEEHTSPTTTYYTENKTTDKYFRPLSLNGGLYYNITPKDLITSNINIGWSRLTDSTTKISTNPSSLNSLITGNRKTLNPNFSIDYQHSFDKEGAFFTLSYLFDSDYTIATKKDTKINGTLGFLQDPIKTRSNENTVQLDFTIPFKEYHKIETGAKYINRYNYSSMIDKADPSKNREYEYTYNIAALYADYKLNIKNVSLKVGARGEMSFMNVVDYGKKVDLSPRFDWIPNLSLAYNINPMTNIQFNYNFRVRRPSIWQLSPNEIFESSNFSRVGNPDLKSAKVHKFALTFGHFSPVVSLKLSAAFKMSKDKIENVFVGKTMPDGSVKFTSTYQNVDEGHGFDFSAYLGYNKIQWLRPSLSLGYEIDKNPFTSKYMHFYIVNMSNQFLLPMDFSVDLSGGLFKHKVSNEIEMSGGWYTYLGVTKNFFDKKLSLSLSGNYMPEFMTLESMDKTKFPNISLKTTLERSVSLSITYRFGNSSQNKKTVNKTISNDDVDNGSGGLRF